MSYTDRLKADYRKTFRTTSGKHVLVDLYQGCGGNRSSLPESNDPIRMAFNEGMRAAYLRIMYHLKEDDGEMRKLVEEHNKERLREDSL